MTTTKTETTTLDRLLPAVTRAAATIGWPVCFQQYLRYQAERARERSAR